VSQDQIEKAIQLIEDYYGEKVLAPELEPVSASQKYGFQLDYVGIPKGRNFDKLLSGSDFTPDERIAFGLSNKAWRIIFSEKVLKAWFEKAQVNHEETLFSLLLVSESANDQEIKSGYRRLARQWHPDVCKEENASEMFKKINEAYLILSDPAKRQKYKAGLYFERSREQSDPGMGRFDYPYFIPPLRCGNLTVTGSVSVGRLRVTEILKWEDVQNEQGQTMVSSWSKEREAVVIEWV